MIFITTADSGAGPETFEKTSSRGWLDTLVDLGYGRWWLFACWQALQTESFISWAKHGRLNLLTTLWTMENNGWSRQLWHRSMEALKTPQAILLTPNASFCKDDEGRG
jgi:hypothetical protein